MPTLIDNMDGQEKMLRPQNGTADFKILEHTLNRKLYRHGSGAERVLLAAPAGHSVRLTYNLPAAPVINELRIAAWFSSNRPGVRLGATIVLPRTLDKTTGQPYKLLIRGIAIGQGANWEKLVLEKLPDLLDERARVARATHGHAVDERGAYVSQIVLMVPGGVGATEINVDRLEVYGVLGSNHGREELKDSMLVLDPERPTKALRVPQIIQWQGESFELLKNLGFDTVGMSRLPSQEELRQTQQLGMSIVCPPPSPQQLSEQVDFHDFSPVLAWDLGEQLSTSDLDQIIRWQELLSRYDPVDSRPTIVAPHLFTREASRVADVILLGRTMLGTEVSLRDHATWLDQRRRLTRPGSDTWTAIETQLNARQIRQLAALQLDSNNETSASYGQLVALTSAAFAAKSRGLYFTSHSSLAMENLATQRRAMALELNNLRLRLAEPWLASGNLLESSRCSQPDLSALVMKSERSYLLVPMRWSNTITTFQNQAKTTSISFTIPGAAESAEAYLLTLGGAKRLRHQRVTGGVSISVEELPTDAFLLLSDDQQAISQVTSYVRKIAPRAAQLRRNLAVLRLQETTTTFPGISSVSRAREEPDRLLAQARAELHACERSLASKSYDLAFLHADAADRSLDQHDSFMRSTSSENVNGNATSDALYFGLTNSPAQHELQRRLTRAPAGVNRLKHGGFENLSQLLEAGWQHRQLSLDGITSAVRLSPEKPHSGSYCLELEAQAIGVVASGTIVSSSPVWINSAPVTVQEGDLIEISGVTRIPAPLQGTVDGLQVIDSLGGPELALRIRHSPSWQPFRLIRVAPSDGEITISIALTGLGKAQIDDVAIRTVRLPDETTSQSVQTLPTLPK